MRYAVSVGIQRPADEVFAFLSDLRNELRWNPEARSVTKLTPGPIGAGTRFEAAWAGAPKSVVEITLYEPPRAWETRSRSLGMDVTFRGSLVPADGITRYTADVAVEPRRLGRLIAPLAVRAMRRQEGANMERIKDALENGASFPTPGDGGDRDR